MRSARPARVSWRWPRTERRRLERDLQAGAEQHLVALRVKLGLVGAAGAEEDERLIAEIGEELDATMDDLRLLAHGIYPPLLREEGLGSALRAAARRSPVLTTVDAGGVGRLRADVESVLYFCCLEAMRNAAAHAGPGATIACASTRPTAGCGSSSRTRVAAWDAARAGGGLTAMRERLHAVDGTVTIESEAGRGTTVRGEIPIPAA